MKTVDLRPWKRLLPVWLPAVIVAVAAAAVFLWQTSEAGGARSRVTRQVTDLEDELRRLRAVREAAGSDLDRVAELDQQFEFLFDQVFGSLEERLTAIMRAVGSATSNAGLRPSTYSYSATEDHSHGFIRFSIRFSVDGEYRQIRQMLAELQASPEFLVVDNLSLSGEEEPVTRLLQMSVSLSTFLAEADADQLRRLTGAIARPVERNDG